MRIAVIDLLFYWPPGGGSHVDVKEIVERLSKDHEVKLFLPNVRPGAPFKFPNMDFMLKRTKFFNRGKIKTPVEIETNPIEFSFIDFNFKSVPKRFLNEIDKFRPGAIFFAQGSFLRPYVINALKSYRIISRFYSHEAFCLKGDGQYFKKGRICNVDPLDGGFRSYLKCLFCSSSFLMGYPSPLFIHEYMLSTSFLRKHFGTIKESLANTDTVMVYNNFIRSRLEKHCRKVITVPGGVDLDFFDQKNPKSHDGTKKILMLGRSDDPAKGFAILFQAGKILWQKRKDFRIMVSVRDNLPPKYRAEFVENLGWRPHNDVPKIYASADMVVVPSIWAEPFGIVATEAMASGKAVVASNVGALPGIVDDGKTGFLFDPLNAKELANKIGILLDNPGLSNEMGERGKRKVRERYGWDTVYERYYRDIFLNP